MSDNGGNGSQSGDEFIVAIDAGGTMTDCILFREDGTFHVGKALTNRADERKSYLESVADAAAYVDLTSADVHARSSVCIYTGTGILNTILTLTGARVGLIVTRGWDHIMIGEGALTWIGEPQEHILHQQLRRHTAPLVPPGMVVGVSERILGGNMYPGRTVCAGDVIIPLNESEVVGAAEQLLADGAEVIGILFLNSFVNPTHELQAKAIVESVVAAQEKDVRVITSHEVAPEFREYERASTTAADAYLAPIAARYLRALAGSAVEAGLPEPVVMLSSGGVLPAAEAAAHPARLLVSGPAGGVIGAGLVARRAGPVQQVGPGRRTQEVRRGGQLDRVRGGRRWVVVGAGGWHRVQRELRVSLPQPRHGLSAIGHP